MVTPTRVVLLRHGQTEWNHTGRLQGQADVHLDETGVAQAAVAAEALAGREFAALYSSDLLRASVTAATVGQRLGLVVNLDPRLREINVGSWAGKTRAEVEQEFPEFGELYFRGIDFRRSATGETVAEMADRAMPAIDEIVAAHPGQDVLVVAHGFLIQKLVQRLLGIAEEARLIGTLSNAHWTEVGITPDYAWLVSHNVGALAGGTPAVVG